MEVIFSSLHLFPFEMAKEIPAPRASGLSRSDF
jgi:hypothetical protein